MKSVIYLDRDTLFFYGGNVHTVLSLPFAPNAVKDMEVIDEGAIEKQIDTFIQTNKIEPTESFIIFSHRSCFSKVISANSTQENLEKEKRLFLEFVPFDHIAHKILKTSKGNLIVAANKELANIVRHIFQKHGSVIQGVSTLFTIYPDNTVSAMSLEIAKVILRSYNRFREDDLLTTDESQANPETVFEQEFAAEDKKNNIRLYLMLGFFIVSIGLLGYMLNSRRVTSTSRAQTPLSPTRRLASPNSPSPQQTPTYTPTPSPTVASVAKDQLTVRILNGSGISGQADEIKDSLVKINFVAEKITTGNTPNQQSTTTRIVFTPRVSSSIREEISDALSEFSSNVSTIENDEIEFDILITTAP